METLRMIFELSDLNLTHLVKVSVIFFVMFTLINAVLRSRTICIITLVLFLLYLLSWKEGGDYCGMVRGIVFTFSYFVGSLVGYVVGDIFRGKSGNEEE
ncbi:MAG: hypothetical protein Q4F38_09575 [Akkermansia sp.]|nr:hypothetical protein [Akkermansia sp.]